MRRATAYRHPAWFHLPVNRLRLIARLQTVTSGVTVTRPSPRRKDGFAVRCTLTPAGLGPQRITIEFSANNPENPHIFVPGPGSPHRYGDGSLCIWYPHDPPEQRWRWVDGGAALAGHIYAHLIREAWWRQTGEWVGEEMPHD